MEPLEPNNRASGDNTPCTPRHDQSAESRTHGHGQRVSDHSISSEEARETPLKKHPLQPRFLPPALKSLGWIAGKWSVYEPGRGHYPTIKDFAYSERLDFSFNGQPMLDYKAESWNPTLGCESLLHREAGFLRIEPGTDRVALVLAHNFGVSEILEGSVKENEMVLETTRINRMSFAPETVVLRTRRTFTLVGDHPESQVLEHVMEMETSKTPLTEHLRIKYKREMVHAANAH